MLRLRVTYHRNADLFADDAGQFAKGGLLVRVAPPPELALFDQVMLEIAAAGETASLPAQVVQTAPDAIAVMFDRRGLAELLAAAAAVEADAADAPPEHELVDEAAEAARAAETPRAPVTAASRGANTAKKIHQALHGNKDERAAIMRDINKQLHLFVLKNPQLGVDEVLAMAKMATMGADVLTHIAARREWFSRPEIAIALVRNPKVPTGVAVKLLDHVSVADLRQLAKDSRTRTPIQQAARKKVI